MRTVIAIVILMTLISHSALAEAEKIPTIEPGIYTPNAPFETVKQSFYVRERERPLLSTILEADTSIAVFLIDLNQAVSTESIQTIRSILPNASKQLRPPPVATFDQSTRYYSASLYCWKSESEGQLEFFVDWGDITTNARYTDSYIFVRRGTLWYFKEHGKIAPRHWIQSERYFQRACPQNP
ncbi:hypothetical protein [Duganella radicis]|uniref:Uncharacterized protein n=1 Tax=Duganella radicis TaxID=551988 RepID=A0A6L6PN68_9BURK|nr:hypothetical protein [Duganella radicis]MTV40179.1 hypothetical protein [Duganella radicis]